MEIVKTEKLRRRKKTLRLKLLIIFLIIISIYFFLHSSFFSVSQLEFNGNISLDTEKLISLLAIDPEENLIFLKKQLLIYNLSVNPMVKEVEIIKKIPNTLLVKIVERQPIGLLVCADGFIQLSEDGYFLALLRNIGKYEIPLINGLAMEYLPGPGQKIENNTLLLVLEMIKLSDPGALKHIAEINMADVDHILAYTSQGAEIRLGNIERMEEKISNLDLILLEIIGETVDGRDIEYIDLRFSGPPIVKKKI